jgi:hypothetical protein
MFDQQPLAGAVLHAFEGGPKGGHLGDLGKFHQVLEALGSLAVAWPRGLTRVDRSCYSHTCML